MNVLIIIGVSYVFMTLTNTKKMQWLFWIGLIIKLFFTLGAMEYYSGGDMPRIFEYSKHLNEVFTYQSPKAFFNILLFNDYPDKLTMHHMVYWGNPRSFFIMKICSLLNFLSGSRYVLNSFYFSLIAYLPSFWLISMIKKKMRKLYIPALLSFLFLPSVIFNSSGIIKESIVFFSITLMVAAAINMSSNTRSILINLTLITVGGMVLYKVKYFYLVTFMPILAFYLFDKLTMHRYRLIGFGILVLTSLAFSSIYEAVNFSKFTDYIALNHATSLADSLPGRTIQFSNYSNSMLFFILNSPLSLLYGLAGPFIFEAMSWASIYIGIENLVILIILLYYLFRIISGNLNISAFEKIFWFYILAMAIVLPLASPNFGSLTRYKVCYLPFLTTFILRSINFEFLKEKIIWKILS